MKWSVSRSIRAHGKVPGYYATAGHDDMMMSSIWALYILKPELIENYYDVRKFCTDKLGNSYPLFITSTEKITKETKEFMAELDTKFKNTNNQYEISMNQLEMSVNKNQQELMEQFTINEAGTIETTNQPEVNSSDEDFQFMGFST